MDEESRKSRGIETEKQHVDLGIYSGWSKAEPRLESKESKEFTPRRPFILGHFK